MRADTETLKSELDGILKNYGIPLEDRTLILERIETAMDAMIDGERQKFDGEVDKIRRDIAQERDSIRHELEDIRSSAINSVEDLTGQVEEAYEEGFSDGLEVGSKGRSNTLQIVLGLGVIALAMVIVVGTILKKS